jgi:hypothetical protein
MDVNYEQSPPEDLLTLANGQWVLVNYDGANYPGEVVEISEKQQEVKVNTMESVGKNWRWPKKADCIFYKVADVIRVISPPVVVNARGQFKFDI